MMRKYLDDVCFVIGAALVTVGAGYVHPGLAFATAGGFFLLFSFMLGKAMNK